MTEKHPSRYSLPLFPSIPNIFTFRNTKSLGPNFSKVLSLGTDSSYLNSKREHKHTTQHSETDIFQAKTYKTPHNPVLSYKSNGNDYYGTVNTKIKSTKAASNYSHGMFNQNPQVESDAERLLRQSPVTADEMAWYQLMDYEKNRNAGAKGVNFGTLPLEDSRGYQSIL